jgi:hypothetical protein
MEKERDSTVVNEKIVESFEKSFASTFISDYTLWDNITIPIYWWWTDLKYGLKCLWQQLTTGFKHEEAWNICNTHASWIVPRLRMMRDNLHGHPCGMKHGEWENILDEIIWAFDNMGMEPPGEYPEDYDHRCKMTTYQDGTVGFENLDRRTANFDKQQAFLNRQQKGFDLFSKHYFDLWD